jgi:hypothetical protein
MILSCTNEEWVKLIAVFVAFFAYSIAEFYIGKKHGSAIQILIKSVKKLFNDNKKKKN